MKGGAVLVFSSLLFLCIFLPLNLTAYYMAPKNTVRNAVMLGFSIIFYAWGEPVYVSLLLFMTLVCWIAALNIEKQKTASPEKAKAHLICATVISLLLIGIFKYSSFVLNNFSLITGIETPQLNIALPIGISFYTFQLLTYVVDVYRGDACAQKNYANLLLYASLFHQCVAGPIVRYSDIEKEILHRRHTMADFNKGVMRFSSGLAKKVLLSNRCGAFTDTLVLSDRALSDASLLAENITALSSASALTLWAGMLFYMLQIYLDFSAYSDMAIGMGLMTGFHYKENFDYPYISASVTEFWRRWHISLGTFFRDYVYIPLGGNRKGTVRTIFNLFVVWGLTGLWHGASWNFVLWGLYFFVFLVAEKLFLGKLLKKLPSFTGHIYLIVIVYFGWVLFRFENTEIMFTVLRGMFCANGNSVLTQEILMYLKDNFFFIVIAAFACTPIVKTTRKYIDIKSKQNQKINVVYSVFRAVIPAVLVLTSALCLVGDSYNPFLYFRF